MLRDLTVRSALSDEVEELTFPLRQLGEPLRRDGGRLEAELVAVLLDELPEVARHRHEAVVPGR